MANAVRYYFDEHLPSAAVTALRGRGIDVLTVVEAGRVGQPDDEQLRFATAGVRVMVTHDPDYLALAADFQASGEPFAGVAFGTASRFARDVGGLVRALADLHDREAASGMSGRVEYL